MQEKANIDLVRRQNRSIVLSALRRQGPMARVELGRATGLSPASITAIAAQLISENVLEELAGNLPLRPVAKRGRPVVQLGLRPQAALVLAGTIAIDALALSAADFSGRVVASAHYTLPTYEADADSFSAAVIDHIRDFLRSHRLPRAQVARIGLAVQGMVNTRDGTLQWSPAFRARNIPLAEPVAKHFRVPCFVANDANMIAEGFAKQDSNGRGGVTATIFTGYGVGMGLIMHGQVFHGSTGAASEFGHMNHIPHGALCRCGRRGCIEAYAADYGIVRTAKAGHANTVKHQAVPRAEMESLLERARTGDALPLQAFATAGEALGFGIARLLAILNPDRIVVAGPGLSARAFIEPALRQAISDGVLEEMRGDVAIEFVSFETDMILRGTIDALLRQVDEGLIAVPARPDAVEELV